MKISVPTEIKNNEFRVGLTPGNVQLLVQDGHQLFVQAGAGHGIGIEDELYKNAGATILPTIEDTYDAGEMIIKVKEPQASEIALLRPKHLLYTYLHLAADKALTEGLMKSKSTCIAYETIQELDGTLPLLTPMSEVAGRMATQIGASYLQKDRGGKGVLLGGVPGVKRGKIVILGCGVAGLNAMKMAIGLGAEVVAMDLNLKRLAQLDDLFGAKIKTIFSNPVTIEQEISNADLVIGSVLVPGAKAPRLVTRQMLKIMEKKSVIIDIAVDQGGCIETCRPTTHAEPTFIVDDIIHYCVANMPGAVPHTSTYALNNATLRYARMLASMGVEKAASNSMPLAKGVNILKGDLVYKQVADDLHLPYTSFLS